MYKLIRFKSFRIIVATKNHSASVFIIHICAFNMAFIMKSDLLYFRVFLNCVMG